MMKPWRYAGDRECRRQHDENQIEHVTRHVHNLVSGIRARDHLHDAVLRRDRPPRLTSRAGDYRRGAGSALGGSGVTCEVSEGTAQPPSASSRSTTKAVKPQTSIRRAWNAGPTDRSGTGRIAGSRGRRARRPGTWRTRRRPRPGRPGRPAPGLRHQASTGVTRSRSREMYRSGRTGPRRRPAGSTPVSSSASRSAAPPGRRPRVDRAARERRLPGVRRSDWPRCTKQHVGTGGALAEQDQDRRLAAARPRGGAQARSGTRHRPRRVGQAVEPARDRLVRPSVAGVASGRHHENGAGSDQLAGHRRVGRALAVRRAQRARSCTRRRRAGGSGRLRRPCQISRCESIVHSERGNSAPTSCSTLTGSSSAGPAEPARRAGRSGCRR